MPATKLGTIAKRAAKGEIVGEPTKQVEEESTS